MIHFKDYIDAPTHINATIETNHDLVDNIVSFKEPNRVSKEYIGKFVDQLMEMPDDPQQNIDGTTYENIDSAMDIVAARILSEEKW